MGTTVTGARSCKHTSTVGPLCLGLQGGERSRSFRPPTSYFLTFTGEVYVNTDKRRLFL